MVAIQRAFDNLADVAYHLVLSHHSHCLQGPHAGKGKILVTVLGPLSYKPC